MRFKSRQKKKKTILKGIKCDQVGGIESHSPGNQSDIAQLLKKEKKLTGWRKLDRLTHKTAT